MSALKKKDFLKMPTHEGVPAKTPPSLVDAKKTKAELESYREQLQKRILDNPKVAKKAAVIISNWINKPKK
jgi:hypothetical protein